MRSDSADADSRKGQPGIGDRIRIYQLMVRHFGNTNESRVPDGTLQDNGCGKFADIDEVALESLKEMGFSHLWLTGVLEQASGTYYPHRRADDPDILKGRAGSPYAIADYFDVCADYAVNPEKRLVEFRALLSRCERAGLKTLIDLVPNHVARSYASDVMPELSFGCDDDRSVFFARDNNFYYLQPGDAGDGPPLRLPADGPGCDGLFPTESEWGRVTGNNARTWAPSLFDWYETVKLNYGHDYSTGRDTSHLPGPEAPEDAVPDTWRKMDAVIAYWQGMGVDGFRADMAHMVPLEFWEWAIGRARARDAGVFFMAEAYDGDPAKLTDRHVLGALVENGFDAVYDGDTYELLKGISEGPKWANDLDGMVHRPVPAIGLVRYAENHDEVRLANHGTWGGLGMQVGRAATALLFASGSGPVMIYNGQEVGEPAEGASGFSGDDGRSTIFDYWSLPELAKWVNGHRYDGGRLSREQADLREWYGRLLKACAEPAFVEGEFVPLNGENLDNPAFGRLDGETASGHWCYAFLRILPGGGQAFLVVVNLHGSETLRGLRVRIPGGLLESRGWGSERLTFADRLASDWSGEASLAELGDSGLGLPDLTPCSALFLELS